METRRVTLIAVDGDEHLIAHSKALTPMMGSLQLPLHKRLEQTEWLRAPRGTVLCRRLHRLRCPPSAVDTILDMTDTRQTHMLSVWLSGEEVLSCTILTCGPNKAMGELHNRMPVILAEYDWPQWLGEESASEQDLLALLKPCPDEALKIWPVDRMVGNVKNNGPQLVLPVLSNAISA
jgi:hypothetical protein